MSTGAISEEQNQALGKILATLADECSARAAAVCDNNANVLAQYSRPNEKPIDTVSALAVGAFAATRELADNIGESGFQAISYRGESSGLIIRTLGGDYILLVVLSKDSTEGLVRLYLRKITREIRAVLDETEGQTVSDTGAAHSFEVQEIDDEPGQTD